MSASGATHRQPVSPAVEPDVVGSPSAGPAALRGSVLRSGGYAVTVLLSLISAPLLIRHLGEVGFGRYTTVVALVTIIAGLTDAGLVNIALREWSTRASDRRTESMRSLLGIRMELSGAGVLVGVLFALAVGYQRVLVLGTLIAGVGMVLQTVADLLTTALRGELRFGWASVIDVARQAVAVALIVVLVVTGAGLLPFFAVTIPAGLLTLVLTAILVRAQMPLVPRIRGGDRWRLLRDMLPYSAATAVNTLYFRVTIVAMSLIAAARQTGYFATSFRVTEVLVGIPALAIGAAFPILARAAQDDQERFAHATSRILELALIVGIAVVLVVVLSAPFVIQVLAGRAGAPAAAVLQIQGIGLAGTFLATAAGFPLLSLGRTGALLIANGGALIANIVLTIVLVPLAQAKGAAIAAVLAESCLAAGQLTLLTRLQRLRLSPATLVTAVVGAGIGALPLLIGGIHPLLRMALGLAAYLAVLAVARQIPPELAEVLRRKR
jgi:O-antigen/teichoic acid export membrane protein